MCCVAFFRRYSGGHGVQTRTRAWRQKDSAANSLTALRDFNGFLKALIIEKPPGVVAR
jgi:hypothetical protein